MAVNGSAPAAMASGTAENVRPDQARTYLACFCSARDEVDGIPAEPVRCWSCGDLMHAYAATVRAPAPPPAPVPRIASIKSKPAAPDPIAKGTLL